MTRPVRTIRNLGPAMERAFARAGIGDAETLHALGPDAAYGRLLETGHKPHFMGYIALAMGLQGRPWSDCRGDEKAALRRRFDALVAACRAGRGAGDALERALDEIGVIAPDGRK